MFFETSPSRDIPNISSRLRERTKAKRWGKSRLSESETQRYSEINCSENSWKIPSKHPVLSITNLYGDNDTRGKLLMQFFIEMLIMCCLWTSLLLNIPAGIYLLEINNRNTRTGCEICSKLTMVSLLLTLNIFHTLF